MNAFENDQNASAAVFHQNQSERHQWRECS